MKLPPCHTRNDWPLAALVCLLAACASGPESAAHGTHRIVLRQQVFNSVDWERGLEGFSGEVNFDAETNSTGLVYEHFVSGKSSWLVGLLRRSYEIDLPDADNGDGTEFLWAGRRYFRSDASVQPFLGGGLRVGAGLEWEGDLESNVYFGFQLGGGIAFFLGNGLTFDLGVDYESTFIRTSLPGSNVVEDAISGVTGLVGIGWAF